MSNRLHKVDEDEKTIRHVNYRFIPYDEMAEILRNDEKAEIFLEDSEDRPLKRQTIWYAAKKLTEMIGEKVNYCKSILVVEDGSLKGYSFMRRKPEEEDD